MDKPHICMFCRYRKTRARDLQACCAGAEILRAQEGNADRPPQNPARGMPERLRQPTPRQSQPSR